MRIFILAGVAAVSIAACDQKPAPTTAPAIPAAAVAPAPAAEAATPGDANAMTLEQISAKLPGKYVSTEDAKANLLIGADGKWGEVYEGADPNLATWRVFTGDKPPADVDKGQTFTPASRYLEVKDATGALYYELGGFSDTGFDMFYTARGNHLSYQRVKDST